MWSLVNHIVEERQKGSTNRTRIAPQDEDLIQISLLKDMSSRDFPCSRSCLGVCMEGMGVPPSCIVPCSVGTREGTLTDICQ